MASIRRTSPLDQTARASDYFYYTETDSAEATRYLSAAAIPEGTTVKYIWYHFEPNAGMMLIVR